MEFKIMLNCKETARLISDELEHPIPLYSRMLLKMHLVMCSACTQYRRQIKALKNLITQRIKSGKEPLLSKSSLSDEIRNRIKSALRK